ncbi:unnamed protein product [Diabrotica balteata]|uniref:Uncharacterized protein n=1 Tax=Diabrotica balteata TaxID=107213 RepID=A0A9N9SXF3_DIABA|nr:unnamed protein product [Diabrotica balteata]
MNNKRIIFKELPLEIEDVDKEAYEKFKVPNLKQFGTTLVSELVYLLVNDLNFQKAAGEDLHDRVPNLE